MSLMQMQVNGTQSAELTEIVINPGSFTKRCRLHQPARTYLPAAQASQPCSRERSGPDRYDNKRDINRVML